MKAQVHLPLLMSLSLLVPAGAAYTREAAMPAPASKYEPGYDLLRPDAQMIAPGVFQQSTADGLQTIGIGKPAREWRIERLEEQLAEMYANYDFSEEAEEGIAALEDYQAVLLSDLEQESATSCSLGSLTFSVSAGPVGPGAKSSAKISYSGSCAANAYAQAVANANGYTQYIYNGASNKTSLNLSSSAYLSGSSGCTSHGEVYLSGPLYLWTSMDNGSCY